MNYPIEQSAAWEKAAKLPFTHQRTDRPGGICCPHCGSTEFFGGTAVVLLKKLRETKQERVGVLKNQPQCAVCEHTWTLKIIKARTTLDADFVEWVFESIPENFEPVRVLARYYQLKAGRLARDKNGESIGQVQL